MSATDPPEENALACPVDECLLYIDLVLESSNGVRFGAHKTNLELYSDGFPIAKVTQSDSEVVKLSENDSVLRLLLQFMHNARQPEMSSIFFEDLELLAEAVEKYMIFSAIQVCRMQMEKFLLIHPLRVFLYAAKHDYSKLADLAAPSLVRTRLEEFLDHASTAGLHGSAIFRFIHYRERWSDVLHILYVSLPVVLHRGGAKRCDRWTEFYNAILLDVGLDAGSLSYFSDTVEKKRSILEDCGHCWIKVGQLKQKIADAISKIPSFSKV